MSPDFEIREPISRYLRGEIGAADLEALLSVEAWDMDQESPATQARVYDALRLLSEAGNGDWTDEELAVRLRSIGMTNDQFFERLSVAEGIRGTITVDATAVLLGYARTARAEPYESEPPNAHGFLRQPKGESKTLSPHPKEPALG